MFETHLFYGFEASASFAHKLSLLDPKLTSLFIGSGETMLQEYAHEGKSYLGKFVLGTTTLQNLELLEANIYSLLKKIDAAHPFEEHPLVLLPVVGKNVS